MNTILITGCAGLIGSHLSQTYLELGYKVVGIDSLVGGYSSNLPIHSSFYFYNIDILDTKQVSDIFKLYNPEAVIHCAALAHEGLSVFSPKIITENIYAGTISIASAAIAAGTKTFINTSSMARYGDITPPFTEDSIPNPVDPYGMAKLHAEQQLNLLSDIHGLKVFHVIPHNVCGPNQCYTDPFRNVMSIFANRVMHDRPIYIYGDGEQKRSFSHVTDSVKAFTKLHKNSDYIANKSVFNIGPDDGSEVTINKLAKLVSAYFNKPENVIHLPPRPQEVKHAWVSTDKAKQILQYEAAISIDETVRDTITWVKNSGKKDFDYHLELEIVNEHTPKTWTDKLFNE